MRTFLKLFSNLALHWYMLILAIILDFSKDVSKIEILALLIISLLFKVLHNLEDKK